MDEIRTFGENLMSAKRTLGLANTTMRYIESYCTRFVPS